MSDGAGKDPANPCESPNGVDETAPDFAGAEGPGNGDDVQPTTASASVADSPSRDEVPRRGRPVVHLALARDERPAVSVDGHQPTVLDSYVDPEFRS